MLCFVNKIRGIGFSFYSVTVGWWLSSLERSFETEL